MNRQSPTVWIVLTALLHFGFMLGELLPVDGPKIMDTVLRRRNLTLETSAVRPLVQTIVRNAAVYNGMVAAALLAAAYAGQGAAPVTTTLLVGVMAAGIVGMSLSPLTIVQTVCGALTLWFLHRA